MQPERCAPTTDSHVRTVRYATTRRGRASARPLLRIRLGAGDAHRTTAQPLLTEPIRVNPIESDVTGRTQCTALMHRAAAQLRTAA